jgi:hypothetical protein
MHALLYENENINMKLSCVGFATLLDAGAANAQDSEQKQNNLASG